MRTLAERLEFARDALGLSQGWPAQAASVSQSTIESGARNRPREILSIAKAGNVNPEQLLNGVVPRSVNPNRTSDMNNPFAFFHRIEGLDLIEGNKTAAFDFVVSTAALQALSHGDRYEALQIAIIKDARERIVRANLLSRKAVANVGIAFRKDTLVPRILHCDMAFGGSIAADPEVFGRLSQANAVELLGDEIRYTSHNLDTSREALALVVLAHTWAEYAGAELMTASSNRRQER